MKPTIKNFNPKEFVRKQREEHKLKEWERCRLEQEYKSKLKGKIVRKKKIKKKFRMPKTVTQLARGRLRIKRIKLIPKKRLKIRLSKI